MFTNAASTSTLVLLEASDDQARPPRSPKKRSQDELAVAAFDARDRCRTRIVHRPLLVRLRIARAMAPSAARRSTPQRASRSSIACWHSSSRMRATPAGSCMSPKLLTGLPLSILRARSSHRRAWVAVSHRLPSPDTATRILVHRNLHPERLFGSDGPAAFRIAVALPSGRSASCYPPRRCDLTHLICDEIRRLC
jgi:hypothetical protein